MRGFLRTLAVTGAATAALLGAGLTGTAAAQAPAATRLTGGTTTVTTGPGVAGTLLRAGILPVATPPGRQSFSVGRHGLATSFSFPVTGGAVDLTTLAGTIKHRGGIVRFEEEYDDNKKGLARGARRLRRFRVERLRL